MMSATRTIWFTAAFLLSAIASVAWGPSFVSAQVLPAAETEEAAAPAPDVFERQTPRSSVTALLDALASGDYDKAAHYFTGVADPVAVEVLPTDAASPAIDATPEDEAAVTAREPDGSDSPEAARAQEARVEEAVELARKLKLALDSGGRLVPFTGLSNEPTGDFDDGLDPTLERVGMIEVDGERQPILMQRVEIADTGIVQWRIAPETELALAGWEPPAAVIDAADSERFMIGGALATDWLKLIALAVALFIAARAISAAGLTFLRKAIERHDRNIGYRIVRAAFPPLVMFAAVAAYFLIAGRMEVAIVARQLLLRGAGLLAWASLGWFLLRFIDAISRLATERMELRDKRQAAALITLARRAAKIALIVIVGVALFDTLGVDVTTGIAALGIGGLALALGAQKTIENFVGSLSVIADKPVEVGDTAQIGAVFGTVEDVGIRSTKVRTLGRTLVSIPNGDLAAERIENYAARDRFLFRHTIGVSYDTDAGRMRDVLAAFRAILESHDHIVQDSARVRFIGFADSAINIELFLYFRTLSFPESLLMQENLLLELMAKLEEMEVVIAFPTRTIIVQGDGMDGPQAEKR